MTTNDSIADVGIVGAGFAGLAAALMLRRHRDSVLLFDGGPCRNAWAKEVHGYLGVKGLTGAQMRDLGLTQVREVGAQVVQTQVATVRNEGRQGFVLEVPDSGEAWRVRRLLLATGVVDQYPDIDNFFDFYGKSVHVCPHCDAFEWRDQPVAIVTWNHAALPFALKMTQWTKRITVVTDGRSPDLSEEERHELTQHGIGLLTQTVRRFEGQDGQLEALRFVDGSTIPARAAFFNIGTTFQNDLARQLGCALFGPGAVQVDDHMCTTVDNVWAAGDITGEEQLVSVAASQGIKAAVSIYRSLPLPSGEPQP